MVYTERGQSDGAALRERVIAPRVLRRAATPPSVLSETFPAGPRQLALGEHRVPLASVAEGGGCCMKMVHN